MSDKLVPVSHEIATEKSVADELVRTVKYKTKREYFDLVLWPAEMDLCVCGHAYSKHNYSDSLPNPDDALGFMYECTGAGWDDETPNCLCEQFVNENTR